MRRKAIMTLVLAAALAFTPMGGQLAMTANASGSEAVEGSEATGESGVAEESGAADESGTADSSEAAEESGAADGSGAADSNEATGENGESAGSGAAGEDSETEDPITLGWTEDGLPTLIVNDWDRVEIYNGPYSDYKDEPLCNVYCQMNGGASEHVGGAIYGANFSVYIWYIQNYIEYRGDGTYRYKVILEGDEDKKEYWSPELVVGQPAEEEPGANPGEGEPPAENPGEEEPPAENPGDEGGTEEPGGNGQEEAPAMNVVTSSTGAEILSTVPIENGIGFPAAVVTPGEEVAAAAGLAQGETFVPVFSGSYGPAAEQAVKAAAASAGVNLAYIFDISAYIDGRDVDDSSVTRLSTPVRFTVGAPDGIDGNAHDFAVIRIHNGSASILPDLDSDPATITFATDRFSVYAVAYTEKGKLARTKDNVPKTGDALPASIPATGVLSAAAFAAMVLFARKRERR